MHWQKTLWKIIRNPTLEVIAAIALVLVAAWIVIETDAQHRVPPLPVLFGYK